MARKGKQSIIFAVVIYSFPSHYPFKVANVFVQPFFPVFHFTPCFTFHVSVQHAICFSPVTLGVHIGFSIFALPQRVQDYFFFSVSSYEELCSLVAVKQFY